MSIHGIHRPGPIVGPQATEARARQASSIPPAPDSPAAETRISRPGQLFSQLTQLSEKNPEEFKAVAQKIADQFRAAAENGTGRERALAQKFAERFGQAAQTGDLSAFRAEGALGHHHHHHHHGHWGGNDEVRSVLQNALDLVHEALSAPSTPTPTVPVGTETSGADTGATPSENGATPPEPLDPS